MSSCISKSQTRTPSVPIHYYGWVTVVVHKQGFSLPPLASILPLGEIAKLIIGPVWPFNSVTRRVRRAKRERTVCSNMGAL